MINDAEFHDLVNTLVAQAEDYRSRLKLDPTSMLEVTLPHAYAQDAVRRYGSLEAAARELFGGEIRLVDAYWRDFCLNVTESVNRRLAALTNLGYFRNIPLKDEMDSLGAA